MKTPALGILLSLAAAAISVEAAYQFVSDGGTFVDLELNGVPATFHMSPSTGGKPAFDGADLGTFSLADGDSLFLSGFTNETLESGGQDIFVGGFVHRVQKTGQAGAFITNYNTGWTEVTTGREKHFANGMTINLLAGLTNGLYELEVYAFAQGNFSPNLLADNGGSNYIATFTVTEEPQPEPEVEVTEHGKILVGFSEVLDTGFGHDLYVVGNHEDVGNWDPVHARKLHWTSGNVWTGQVAIQAGHALEYKLIIRTNTAAAFCDGNNVIWPEGANQSILLPPQPSGPYAAKAVYYLSGWTNANLIYQSGSDTNWYAKDMVRLGPGRTPGEFLYVVDGIGQPGDRIQFVPNGWNGPVQEYDHSPATGGDYYTRLDVLFLQDGQIYNYWPPASVSSSRIVVTNIASSIDGIPSRWTRIYLPRGYDENTWKRYPVLYMHDGTNVFRPGGIYGTWAAETNADHLISLGMMREVIIAAVDNSSNRTAEYMPPGDRYNQPGIANLYADYLVHNVRPTVDTHYRTLNDRDNTLTMGSSFGGQVSLYLGFETNVFGKVGSMSTATQYATNFMGRIDSNNVHGIRVYMDVGTGTGDFTLWDIHQRLYDHLLADGYVVNHDLRAEIGCGHAHSEWAWDLRLPMAYEFLLNIGDEPNWLAQQLYPPELASTNLSSGTVQFYTDTLKGHRYILEKNTNLIAPQWSGVMTSEVETLMWSVKMLGDTSSPTDPVNNFRIRVQ
ncbi:MAG: hypothetical protein KDL10_04300 [Kiritimatiellae bacterium]|nr:hypothetical protein [Kiritimatiellia bacterium]